MVKDLSNYLESETIVNNGTFALNITNKRGRGFVLYGDNLGNVYFEFAPDGTFHRTADDGITFIKDNPLTLNMYTESNDIFVQNKTGAEVIIYHDIRGV